MIHYDPIWSILIHLILFNLDWYTLIHFDAFWYILIHFDAFWFNLIHFDLIHSDIAEEPEEGLTSEDEGSEGSRGSTPKIVNNLTANPNLSISAASNVSSSIVSSTASLNSLTRWSNSSLYTTGNGNTTSQNNQITPIISTNLSKTTVQQTLSNQSSGIKKSNLSKFDPFWFILIHFDPFWLIFRFYPNLINNEPPTINHQSSH